MSHSLLVLLALIGIAQGGSVEIDGATWQALQPPTKEPAEVPPPVAAWREVTLVPVEGGLLVKARWTVRAAESGWFEGLLIGPGAHVGTVTWDGAPATLATTDAGTSITGFVRDTAEIALDAYVPAEQVVLMSAVAGLVHLDGSALSADGVLALSDGTAFVAGGAVLAPSAAPPSADAGDLVLAHAGLGVTIGDAEVAVRARVGWVVRRGRLDAVAISVAGLGDDLDVEGPNVASWERQGDTIAIALREPATDRVDVSLSASALTPAGTEATLALPRVEPLGAFRTESTLQIAREEGLEVVPALAGWQAVPSSSLPEWGRDLVIAAPSSAFRAGSAPGGSLSLLRFEPVALPPLVVDVADHRIATTADGRVLARAMYEIRNERAPWLRIVPPEGWRIVGVRVSGDTARPVTDGGNGWLVPLPRSVDTVSGLLSFPVEVAFLGEGSPWADREETTLALPTVDAEVADWRATLFLPPGFKSRMHPGEADVVEEFASGEGIVYGLSIGGAKVAEADAKFEEAVSAWLDNDFETAQQEIDELRALGAEGENLDKLQSNLDLISGKLETEDYAARQIRSQARARAIDEEREMKELERKADEAKKAGDYSTSTRYYEQALDIGETLEQLEGEESVEVASSNQSFRENVADNEQQQAQRSAVLGEAATTKLPWDVEGDVEWDTSGEVTWDTEGQPDWVPPEPPPETPTPVEFGAYGIAGNAEGGVVGGVVEESYSQNVPMSDAEVLSISQSRRGGLAKPAGGRARGSRGGGGSGRGGGWGMAKQAAPDVSVGVAGEYWEPGDRLPAPEVHASALSITVPEVGETVRFQRRLVPADEVPTLDIDATITVRERRNS